MGELRILEMPPSPGREGRMRGGADFFLHSSFQRDLPTHRFSFPCPTGEAGRGHIPSEGVPDRDLQQNEAPATETASADGSYSARQRQWLPRPKAGVVAGGPSTHTPPSLAAPGESPPLPLAATGAPETRFRSKEDSKKPSARPGPQPLCKQSPQPHGSALLGVGGWVGGSGVGPRGVKHHGEWGQRLSLPLFTEMVKGWRARCGCTRNNPYLHKKMQHWEEKEEAQNITGLCPAGEETVKV